MIVNIDNGCKEITIKLNKHFYDLASIKQSMDDFSELCTSSLKDGNSFEVLLKVAGDSDINTLGYEFCNYVLALMKNNNVV